MNRQIFVSTDVFAAIWGQRMGDEQTEDDVLRRILKCAPAKKADQQLPVATTQSHIDPSYGVEFKPAFVIFRHYKGQQYVAICRNGGWVRQDTGKFYPTLNQLSRSLGIKNENVWANWLFMASNRQEEKIENLRPVAEVERRRQHRKHSNS